MVELPVPDYLAKLNPHERDECIKFDAGPHIYTINNDSSKKYTSVTTWNHSHFAHFDADKIIDNMMRSKKWCESKYYGITEYSAAIKVTADRTFTRCYLTTRKENATDLITFAHKLAPVFTRWTEVPKLGY